MDIIAFIENRLNLKILRNKSNFYYDGINEKAIYAKFATTSFLFGSSKIAGILTPNYILKIKLLSDSEDLDKEYKLFLKVVSGKLPEPKNLLIIDLNKTRKSLYDIIGRHKTVGILY